MQQSIIHYIINYDFDVIVIMWIYQSQSSMQLLWFELLKVYFRTLRLGNTGKKNWFNQLIQTTY